MIFHLYFSDSWLLIIHLQHLTSTPCRNSNSWMVFQLTKMIKTRLRNWISNQNLEKLLRIAIEGTDRASVDLTKILDVFKEKTIAFYYRLFCIMWKVLSFNTNFVKFGGGGGIPGHFPQYETLLDLCYSSCSTVIGWQVENKVHKSIAEV